MSAPVYIFDHVRTPRTKGKKQGGLHEVTALRLSEITLRAIIERNNVASKKIDDVILGCVSPIGEQGACIARSAVLAADYDPSVPGQQINRFCASGLEAVGIAALKVAAGGADFAIGGGVESMSRVPMGSDGGALAVDPSIAFKHNIVPQGVAADLIATHYGFTKKQADEFAVASHKKAHKAVTNNLFKKAILPVMDINNMAICTQDEMIRSDCNYDNVASLQPSFKQMGQNFGFDETALIKHPHIERIDHIHTAANSSAIVDGAAAVLVGRSSAGRALGLTPLVKIKAYTSIGSDPTMMLSGPIDVTKKILKMAKMQADDIDIWEINEAFSSVVLMLKQEMKIDDSKINPYGGSIAMGHPLGATGAMILGTAIDGLIQKNKKTALIVLCVAGGMGSAMIIERV